MDDIKFVINFDYPNCSEDYVHRIGRTGRRDKLGTAYTFFTRDNAKQAKDLIDVLREANQVINPKLQELAYMGSRGGNSHGRYMDRNRRWGGPQGRGGSNYGGSNSFGGGFKRKAEDGGFNGAAKRPTFSGSFTNGYH